MTRRLKALALFALLLAGIPGLAAPARDKPLRPSPSTPS